MRWKGNKGVIIGTANTAHDVAEDMLEAGFESVMMFQRSTPPLMRVSYYQRVFDGICNDEIPTGKFDRVVLTATPALITRLLTL